METKGVVALGASLSGAPVSTGNPYFVVFVDEFPNGWQELAAAIQADSTRSPDFERGAGETNSSGTGTSASAAAAIAERHLTVHAPGGTQTVDWESELFLYGLEQLVCRGEFFV